VIDLCLQISDEFEKMAGKCFIVHFCDVLFALPLDNKQRNGFLSLAAVSIAHDDHEIVSLFLLSNRLLGTHGEVYIFIDISLYVALPGLSG
jgi:hypothetical protein